MSERPTPELEAELQSAVAALDADRTLAFGTWTASQVNEKSVLPPDFAHVVEDVLRTERGAVLRASVGVFGDERHAVFTALARTVVPVLLSELARLRKEAAELEKDSATLAALEAAGVDNCERCRRWYVAALRKAGWAPRAEVRREDAAYIVAIQERVEADEIAEHGNLDHESELQGQAVRTMAAHLRAEAGAAS